MDAFARLQTKLKGAQGQSKCSRKENLVSKKITNLIKFEKSNSQKDLSKTVSAGTTAVEVLSSKKNFLNGFQTIQNSIKKDIKTMKQVDKPPMPKRISGLLQTKIIQEISDQIHKKSVFGRKKKIDLAAFGDNTKSCKDSETSTKSSTGNRNSSKINSRKNSS